MWKKNWEEPVSLPDRPKAMRQQLVLLDFGDVIVHVFDKENRLLYDLERIWRDGVQIPVEEL